MKKITRKIDYVLKRLPPEVQEKLDGVELMIPETFGVYYPKSDKPFIVLNFALMESQQVPLHVFRYLLAHEICHWWLDITGGDFKSELAVDTLARKWGFGKHVEAV